MKIENLQLMLKAEFNDDWDTYRESTLFEHVIEKKLNGEAVTTCVPYDTDQYVLQCD